VQEEYSDSLMERPHQSLFGSRALVFFSVLVTGPFDGSFHVVTFRAIEGFSVCAFLFIRFSLIFVRIRLQNNDFY